MPFELRARIGLDNSPLIAGLEQSKRHIAGFRGAIGNQLSGELSNLKSQFAAAFGAGAIAGGIRSVIAYAGEVDDLSTQLELSHEQVQKLMYVAETTGTSVKKVMQAMGHEAKEFLLTQEQINEKMREFESLNLGMNNIAAFDAMGDRWDNASRWVRKVVAENLVTLEQNTVGLVTDLALMVEGGLVYLAKDREQDREYAYELIAQGLLGRDEEVDVQAEHTRRLEDKLKESKANRAKRESLGSSSSDGPDFEEKMPAIARAKDSIQSSFAHQFDSLARIGGYMQNTDQAGNLAKQQIDLLKGILKTLQGGYGADVQNYL